MSPFMSDLGSGMPCGYYKEGKVQMFIWCHMYKKLGIAYLWALQKVLDELGGRRKDERDDRL